MGPTTRRLRGAEEAAERRLAAWLAALRDEEFYRLAAERRLPLRAQRAWDEAQALTDEELLARLGYSPAEVEAILAEREARR